MLYEDNNKVKAFVLLYVSCAPVCQCPYSCVCIYTWTGSVFRGTFPRRAALQSRGQELSWWGECTNGLWVPPCLFWGVCVCMWMIIFHKDISTLLWNKNKMVQGNVWCECRTRRSRKTWAVWRIYLRMNLIEPFTLSPWTFTKSPHWFGTEKLVPWRYCSLTQPLASVCSHPAQSF